MGLRDPGVRACMQTVHASARQRAKWGAACKGLEGGDGVRTGAGAVVRGGEVGNGGVRVCQVPDACGKGGDT